MAPHEKRYHIRDVMRGDRKLNEISCVAMCGYNDLFKTGHWVFWRFAVNLIRDGQKIPGFTGEEEVCLECVKAWRMEAESAKHHVQARHRIRKRLMSALNMNIASASYRRPGT